MSLRLWLDDMRDAPEGWVRVRSVNEAIEVIKATPRKDFEDASLDNDLGIFSEDGGDGYKLVYWMIYNQVWPTNKPTVHSMNPVRSQTMREDIERHWHDR